MLSNIDPRDVLVLMACSGTKRPTDRPIPAFELYNGPLWQSLRTHLGQVPAVNIRVLSGKFGFIHGHTQISTYEARLTEAKADHLIGRGIHGLNDQFGTVRKGLPGCSAFVEAGATSRCSPDAPRPWRAVIAVGSGPYARVFEAFVAQFKAEGLVAADAPVLRPAGGIGEQRAQLGSWLREINGLGRVVSTPGTDVLFEDLAGWIAQAWRLHRRPPSSAKYEQIKAHWQALPIDWLKSSTDELALERFGRTCEALRLKPGRGARGGTKWELANMAVKNRLWQLARAREWQAIGLGHNSAAATPPNNQKAWPRANADQAPA